MSPLRLSLGLGLLLACLAASTPYAQDPNPAKFVGDLVWRALNDGRLMELVNPFEYIDAKGKSWAVPAGTKVDGASIPQPLWSIVGAPFTGKYRNASVIHDYYCDRKSSSWQSTHLMFYEAMITEGENPRRALLMYYAVLRFGPRWETTVGLGFNRPFRTTVLSRVSYESADFEKMQALLGITDLSLDQLEVKASRERNGKETKCIDQSTSEFIRPTC